MKAKKILKKGHFWLEIVRMNYHFINNKEDYIKVAKFLNIDSKIENTDGICTTVYGNHTAILIGVFDNKIQTLVHECVHASLATFREIGQELSYECEIIAKLTDTIFYKCENKIKEKHEQRKTKKKI